MGETRCSVKAFFADGTSIGWDARLVFEEDRDDLAIARAFVNDRVLEFVDANRQVTVDVYVKECLRAPVRSVFRFTVVGHRPGAVVRVEEETEDEPLRPLGWFEAVMHEHGYEGDHGLCLPRPGETPQQCAERHGHGLWVTVRARKVSEIPGATIESALWNFDVDVDEQYSETSPDVFADWGDRIVEFHPGAEEALVQMVQAWSRRWTNIRAHEVHPEDREKLKDLIRQRAAEQKDEGP